MKFVNTYVYLSVLTCSVLAKSLLEIRFAVRLHSVVNEKKY